MNSPPNPPEAAPEKQPGEIRVNHRMAIAWTLLGVIAGAWGFLGILTFAGITMFDAPRWWPFPLVKVPVLKGPAAGQAVTAAVTWLGGIGAIATFFINHAQKSRIHKETVDQNRAVEAAREKRERDLAELQRIETEFAALADDFAQPEPLAQINAAIGMGEIARRPDPRRVDSKGVVQPDTEHYNNLRHQGEAWPNDWRTQKTPGNYPYFMRAAHRLAAALHQWKDYAARAQAERVLREMGEWSKTKGTDEPLLHQLANALAEANRNAYSLLVNSTANYLAASGVSADEISLDDLKDLHELMGIPGNIRPNASVSFATYPKGLPVTRFLYGLVYDACQQARQHRSQPSVQNDSENLPTYPTTISRPLVMTAGAALRATRDALCVCLRQLSWPPELPAQDTTDWEAIFKIQGDNAPDEIAKALVTQLKVRRALNLSRVSFCGGNLHEANLQGANCTTANFHGAHCQLANFQIADCNWANLEVADCENAKFQGANCPNAHIEEAQCDGANFQGANCVGAFFRIARCTLAVFKGAHCESAQFQGARCSSADFQGAYCREANFQDADCREANFEGARLGNAMLNEHSNFGGSTWDQADFRKYDWDGTLLNIPNEGNPADSKLFEWDQALWNTLNERYPADPPRTPPWEFAAPETHPDNP